MTQTKVMCIELIIKYTNNMCFFKVGSFVFLFCWSYWWFCLLHCSLLLVAIYYLPVDFDHIFFKWKVSEIVMHCDMLCVWIEYMRELISSFFFFFFFIKKKVIARPKCGSNQIIQTAKKTCNTAHCAHTHKMPFAFGYHAYGDCVAFKRYNTIYIESVVLFFFSADRFSILVWWATWGMHCKLCLYTSIEQFNMDAHCAYLFHLRFFF